MSELKGQVRAALADRVTVPPGAEPHRMGWFSAPFRPAAGPLSGHVLKPYRSGRDPELLEQLHRRHETYLDCLGRAGLRLPPTRLILLDEHGVLRPVVVQEAMPRDGLVRNLVDGADTDTALAVIDAVARAVRGFWAGVAQRPERIGLHASIHNFAMNADGVPVFLDTFPPLIGYSRDEMGRLLLRFSESGLIRGIGALLPGRSRELQDPWYTLPGNLALLVEGAIKLRPKDQRALLSWADGFAAETLDASDRSALMTALARPRPLVSGAGGARRLRLGLRPHA